MPSLALSHAPTLAHHITQAEAWLALSDSGQNTASLGYAALELRYAIERLAVHFWAGMIKGTNEEAELLEIGSFNKIEARIYELAGHQRKIDKGFEFAELLCRFLGITLSLAKPNIPLLKKHWHTCSEVCHIGWALASQSPEVIASTFAELQKARIEVAAMAAGYSAIPRLDGPRMHKLQRDYIDGAITEEDVRAFVVSEGLKAEYQATPSASAVPIGSPLQPASARPEACDASRSSSK